MKTELSLLTRTFALSLALGIAALPALAQTNSPPAASTQPAEAGDHAMSKADAAKDKVKHGKSMKDAKDAKDSKNQKPHEQTAQRPGASDPADASAKTGAGK